MAFTLVSPVVSIPLQGLPIPAAALDGGMVIVEANHRFNRLCGLKDSTASGHRLSDIVAEPDRPALEEALDGLRPLSNRGLQSCRIKAWRASPPSLPLTIEVVRLEAGSLVSYFACLEALPRRRRGDRLSNLSYPAARSTPVSDPERQTGAITADSEQWPVRLAALSHELRGPLTVIRGWACMAENGMLPPDRLPRALSVIARNAARLNDVIEKMFQLSRRTRGEY